MGQFTQFVKGNKCEDQVKIVQPRLKEYILSSGWDLFDNRNKWFVDKYGVISYGVETDGLLRDGFGICITDYGWMWISQFNAGGITTKPYISCTADGTK
jgi:hypothetical protein